MRAFCRSLINIQNTGETITVAIPCCVVLRSASADTFKTRSSGAGHLENGCPVAHIRKRHSGATCGAPVAKGTSMKGGKQPGPDHPISVEPADQKVIVWIGGTIVADSANALVLREASLPPVFYIPRADVVMAVLTPSATSTHCPYKGDASYFSAREGAAKDVAWSYEDPYEHMSMIKGHLAFYADRVDAIETAPRG
jgi:uncharacterized protein (DUF427 family)